MSDVTHFNFYKVGVARHVIYNPDQSEQNEGLSYHALEQDQWTTMTTDISTYHNKSPVLVDYLALTNSCSIVIDDPVKSRNLWFRSDFAAHKDITFAASCPAV